MLPRLASSMAGSSRGSSSSPAPSVSSSRSSKSIVVDDRASGSIQYRREEVVGGNFVQISEMARCRRVILPTSDASQQLSHSKKSNGHTVASNYAVRAVKPLVAVHQSKSSPDMEMLLHSRKDSFIDIPSIIDDNNYNPTEKDCKATDSHFELSSPPPTPRIQRLPTPDLEPLKEGRFCDCRGCSVMPRRRNRHLSEVAARKCLSS